MVHNVNIYKDGSDCTNHGATCGQSRALVCETQEEALAHFQAREPGRAHYLPILVIDKGWKYGRRVIPFIHPDALPGAGRPWFMFGGNFVWSSDGRFRSISEPPIPVHDRIEEIGWIVENGVVTREKRETQ